MFGRDVCAGKGSCHLDECNHFLQQFNDEMLAALDASLAQCDDGSTLDSRVSGLKMMLADVAQSCGHTEAISFHPDGPDTCYGAVAVMGSLDKRCPRRCEEDECADGRPSRDLGTCGPHVTPDCGDLID